MVGGLPSEHQDFPSWCEPGAVRCPSPTLLGGGRAHLGLTFVDPSCPRHTLGPSVRPINTSAKQDAGLFPGPLPVPAPAPRTGPKSSTSHLAAGRSRKAQGSSRATGHNGSPRRAPATPPCGRDTPPRPLSVSPMCTFLRAGRRRFPPGSLLPPQPRSLAGTGRGCRASPSAGVPGVTVPTALT